MKRYTFCMTIALVGSLAFAQETQYRQLGNVNTTGTAQNLTGTTGTATMSANAATTSAAAMMNRAFSQENFDKRWAVEEQMYKEAGISEEKIAKIKELNQKMWDARSRGEAADFQELSQQRREILTPEEIEKLRNARREMIQQRMNNTQTTASQQM